MRVALIIALLLPTSAACGGGDDTDEPDGSLADGAVRDGAIDAVAPEGDASGACATPRTEGCACDTPGETTCLVEVATQCCFGSWQRFIDGPCGNHPDAGAPDCDAFPTEPGCPCDADGDTACRFSRWTVVCAAGRWEERVGHFCCGAPPPIP